jgi:hypothetical protein
MLHESHEKNKLIIKDTDLNFESVYSKPYFPKEHEEEIKKANLLLIPIESFRNFNKPVFPEETNKFYDYLREHNKDGLNTEIVIADEDYLELELHSELINLPYLILDKALLPIVIGLITNYIYEKKFTLGRKPKMKVTMSVVEGKKSKSISYEGDPENFERTISAANKEFFKL